MIRVKNSLIEKTTNEKNFMRTLFLFLCMFVSVVAMGQVSIPTDPNSVLQNGVVYTVSTNTTITATTAGQSGLQVAQGAKAVINIKAGVTLTVTGANADANKGFAGMPGILVPETSTLVVIGEGTLVATGGNGTNGLDGADGQNAGDQKDKTATFTYTYNRDMNFGGAGGAGGAGGYGAGAGIGGAGGKGGAGGDGTTSGAKATSYNGAAGNAGQAGMISGGMGNVYVLGKVTVKANAGNGGSKGGNAGKNGVSGYTTARVLISWLNNAYLSIGGGGAGGGGAAGGAPTYAFGAGGTGGGGGGGGGQGGADSNNNYAANAGKTSMILGIGTDAPAMNLEKAVCTAAPGEGGNGSKNGSTTTGVTRDDGPGRTGSFKVFGFTVSSNIQHYPNTGGIGGAAGAQGEAGPQGNVFKLNTATINTNTSTAAKNLQTYTSESQIPAEIRALYEIALSFDNQGGSKERANEILVKGEPVKNLSNFSAPTKAGYTFDGYYTETSGGEKVYDSKGYVVDASRSFNANRMLYANWLDTKYTIVWDYSYIDRDGSRKVVKNEDKSVSATVIFDGIDPIVVPAGNPAAGSSNYAGHTIATATINAVVGSGQNNASTVYVTEDQLKNLSVTAKAILAEENKYVTTNVSSHEVLMAAVPTGTYMQPWSITITNDVKPERVNVQLLSSTSANGPFTVISQMENLSVACENNKGVYTGTYPVWPDNMSYAKLYYKAQIVGYEIDGETHSVTGMPMTDNISSEANQVTLSQSVALPIVHLDLNAPTGTAPHYASGTTEYIYAKKYDETITFEKKSAELQDYKFDGWTTEEGAKEKISSVKANGEVNVYASWTDAIPPVITFEKVEGQYTVNDKDYMIGSLDVYVHIEDANDGTNTEQWYFVADNNKIERLDDNQWIELKDGDKGTYKITIEQTDFAYGYVYIKTKDQDGNFAYMISDQYKVDNQAPFILHEPEGRREDDFSVVCSDNDYPTIDVTIEDNVKVQKIIINGVDVTNGTNLPVGVTSEVVNGVSHFYLAKPGKEDATEYDKNRNPIIPDSKVYTISASDAAGNTATRLMSVYLTHEWNKDADGNYIVEKAEEPTAEKPGLLPHVNCKHCARYIYVKKNGDWTKVDKENPSQLAEVQLLPGSVLVKNDADIFYGAVSINEALSQAKNTYNREGTAQNPIGIATTIKLTPRADGYGAVVDATNANNATLLDPGRPIFLDLNGQSIDKNGVAYSEVTGNANVTILLNDGNNREIGPNPKAKDDIPYRNLSSVKGSPIKYVREFSSIQGGEGNPDNSEGVWQALYLPFNAERSSALTKVGTVDKVEITDTESKIWINKWTEGDGNTVLKAGEKYFIQHGVGTLELYSSDNELNGYSKDEGSQIDSYTIAGSLQSEDHESKSPRSFWVLTNGGYFLWAKVGQQQRPYRWVIYDDNASSGYAPSRDLTLYVIDPNINTDNIEEVDIETIEDAEIYNMSGQKMSKNVQLPRGIYISNGKKFYVK